MEDPQRLSPEQQAQLEMFNEVTANARDPAGAIQLLQACNWNVEQALALHWTAGDDTTGAAASSAPSASSNAASGLAAPLLNPEQGNRQAVAPDRGAAGSAEGPFAGALSRTGIFGRFVQGALQFGATILHVLGTFIFGGATAFLGDGAASGGLLTRALATQYPQLQFPVLYEGSFVQALQEARRDAKLLVVYLHSENGRFTQNFCNQVLSNDFIRMMLDENFLVWGGDITRMESHRVAQMIHARQYPCFCVLLPASVDEIRVIGALNGDIQVDPTVALLTTCLEEMEMHRSEIVARREQHVEDRSLRQEQDVEYQQALEMDKKREEDAKAARIAEEEQQKVEADRLGEEARVAEKAQQEAEDEAAQVEKQRVESEAKRKRKASELEMPGPEAKARICIKLPTGQRTERKFAADATLADVYKWADCLPFLPENQDKGLVVPERFMLKTSFPSRELTEMDRTILELELAGAMVLLAEIEDD